MVAALLEGGLGDREKRILASYATTFRDDFADWLAQNTGIWHYFCSEADRLWRNGFRHYSARTIVHTIRHNTRLFESSSPYKINNNYSPDMARLYMLMYPDRARFFALRRNTKVVTT